mgnify:CR=1 FL=1
MATNTFGTDANNSLTAVIYATSLLPADVATIQQGIKDDKIAVVPNHPIYRGDAFSRAGLLYIPNRGILQCLPGDVIAIDNAGWPILVSADSVAYASSLWTIV